MPSWLFNELAGLGRGGHEYSSRPARHEARALRSDGASALFEENRTTGRWVAGCSLLRTDETTTDSIYPRRVTCELAKPYRAGSPAVGRLPAQGLRLFRF